MSQVGVGRSGDVRADAIAALQQLLKHPSAVTPHEVREAAGLGLRALGVNPQPPPKGQGVIEHG